MRPLSKFRPPRHPFLFLGLIALLALGLRLLVNAWHAQYPLSGDEIGFFEQARAFVQGRGYQDVELMRGPLYPFFLAVVFRLFGAEVSAARLMQALLGAATVPLLYLWAARRHGPRAGLAAAALGALFFPLAVQATTLLTETLFLFLYVLGMVALEWALERPAWWLVLGTGVLFGLATLTRSIGLPLVVLAALAAAFGARHSREPGGVAAKPEAVLSGRRVGREQGRPRSLVAALLVLAGALLVILPWTARNAVVYRSFILVDTTGATNLWLDNDPELGRDRVKAELLKYPEGERSSLAVRNGLKAIAAHPAWFLEKCWGEVQLFFSLEYFDDFLARPAIWYPTAEVWARVLLGDGLYLLLMVTGLVGLAWRSPPHPGKGKGIGLGLDLLWLAYLLGTSALFHVELRYRLPFLVALVPYAAAVLAHWRSTWMGLRKNRPRLALAVVGVLALAGLLLAHANYPLQGYRIAVKRVRLVLGEWALARGNVADAAAQARAALAVYGESSEARVLLAQALWQEEHRDEALAVLRQAIDYRSGHPHPHLLLGDLLRAQGRVWESLPELAYERNSLEDLQAWMWDRVHTRVPPAMELDSGLDLGFVRGWHLPEHTGDGTTFRWSDDRVAFRLIATSGVPSGSPSPYAEYAPQVLWLRLAAGRPEGVPLPQVEVWLQGRRLGRFTVENGWRDYTLEIGKFRPGSILVFELRSTTYRPHAYNPYLDDNRALGVMVHAVGVRPVGPATAVSIGAAPGEVR